MGAEALWPTQCAICDKRGLPLCDSCRGHLPYLDLWRACPRCGAPYGRHQCTECTNEKLKELGLTSLPFDSCVSALHYNRDSAHIVRSYKDKGDRRLAQFLAYMIACVIPPEWIVLDVKRQTSIITYIPTTSRAYLKRLLIIWQVLLRWLHR